MTQRLAGRIPGSQPQCETLERRGLLSGLAAETQTTADSAPDGTTASQIQVQSLATDPVANPVFMNYAGRIGDFEIRAQTTDETPPVAVLVNPDLPSPAPSNEPSQPLEVDLPVFNIQPDPMPLQNLDSIAEDQIRQTLGPPVSDSAPMPLPTPEAKTASANKGSFLDRIFTGSHTLQGRWAPIVKFLGLSKAQEVRTWKVPVRYE